MSKHSRSVPKNVKARVIEALDEWPDEQAHRRLIALCSADDLDVLEAAGYALARCGRWRREAADKFLKQHENDRRHAVRVAVLYARAYLHDDDPRGFVREMSRVASLPGRKPWAILMEELYWMWSRAPREMYRLMTPWLTHRDPHRRWAALHGLEVPAAKDPLSVLKVLRLLRGERDVRVRRLLGHVLGQTLYPRHPEQALEEMVRWLSDGAPAAGPVTRQAERQVALWFDSGRGTERQKRRLARCSRRYEQHRNPSVRAHARKLIRLLEK